MQIPSCTCDFACCVQVKGFEAIRGVTLDAEQFSVENDCMTPTFKFKRPQLQKRYQVGFCFSLRAARRLLDLGICVVWAGLGIGGILDTSAPAGCPAWQRMTAAVAVSCMTGTIRCLDSAWPAHRSLGTLCSCTAAPEPALAA